MPRRSSPCGPPIFSRAKSFTAGGTRPLAASRWWPRTASPSSPIAAPIPSATADIVFVCAGGNPALFADRSVFAWLRRLARKGAVIGGISGGPYLLAKAGLLDERRATLHWEHLPAFREAFPDVAVVPSLFEIDGNRITCSGGISALDMMVAIIEKRSRAPSRGRRRRLVPAHPCSRGLRPAAHGSPLPARRRRREAPLGPARHGGEHRDAAVSRASLARQAGISLRQLERLFRRHIGHGIHRHYRG